MRKPEWLALAGIFFYAIATRVLAFSQFYHQDEYKWAIESDPSTGLTNPVHPPLALWVYTHAGSVIGYAHLRAVPIVLSIALIAALYYLCRRWYGPAAALAVAAVFAADMYALLGSVQIDIDGSFLPLITLVAFAAYFNWLESYGTTRMKSAAVLLVLSVLVGFAIKLSFVLVPAAFIAHFFIRNFEEAKRILLRPSVLIPAAVGVSATLVAGLLLAKHVVFLSYVANFIAISGRDYAQLAFLTAKGLIYATPLLVGGIVLGARDVRRLAPWYVFLAINALFYYVIFDFSHRALDRYLLFLVLPASIMTGYAIARAYAELQSRRSFWTAFAAFSALLAAASHVVWSMPHTLVPLIPKSAFMAEFLSGSLNFLLPLTGGSGPAGFYVPVDGALLLWVFAAVGAAAFMIGKAKEHTLALFLSASLVCSAFMTLEYTRGVYYGSVERVAETLLSKLDADPKVPAVISYNDIAAFELVSRGKYAARFYPHTEYIPANVEKFKRGPGYYFVVQMPLINAESPYVKYFNTCSRVAEAADGVIVGDIFDCRGASFGVFGSI